MSIHGLDHVYVETRAFDRAVAFWKALGFDVESQWGEPGHRACQLVSGAARVVLAEPAAGAAPEGPTVHFALGAAEAMQARLAESDDVKVLTPLAATHWGTRWIRVADPDGHVWVLEAPAGS